MLKCMLARLSIQLVLAVVCCVNTCYVSNHTIMNRFHKPLTACCTIDIIYYVTGIGNEHNMPIMACHPCCASLLASSFYRPLTLSFQSQIIHMAYIYMRLSIIAVISFQEDDGGVRGEVVARLGDVVGEVVAYLVWRT